MALIARLWVDENGGRLRATRSGLHLFLDLGRFFLPNAVPLVFNELSCLGSVAELPLFLQDKKAHRQRRDSSTNCFSCSCSLTFSLLFLCLFADVISSKQNVLASGGFNLTETEEVRAEETTHERTATWSTVCFNSSSSFFRYTSSI